MQFYQTVFPIAYTVYQITNNKCSAVKQPSLLSFFSQFRLGLNTMTLQVASNNVYSGQGVAISVTGIAQVPNPYFLGFHVLPH